MPTSGPVSRYRYNTRDHFDYQQVWKQSKPYGSRPMPYVQRQATVSSRSGLETTLGLDASNLAVIDVGSQNNHLINTCYEKLKGKISDRAELMVAVLEAEKSLDMIYKRATQLLAAVKAASRGDFRRMAKILERPGDVVPNASKWKSLTQNWMEYSFGWVPSVMDIGNAVNVLQSPLNRQWVTQKATGSFPAERYGFTGPYSRAYERQVSLYVVRMGCTVSVENPNLWLANQLGFVNPATVAWELVPFSFVVDWVTNVGQFLASATDFLGLDIRGDYTTFHYQGSGRMYWSGQTSPGGTVYSGATHYTFSGVDRQLGLTRPRLTVKPELITGWRRAAHAVSLLTIGLKSLK